MVEEPVPNKSSLLNPEQPLWLPQGSVRALLAIALVLVTSVLVLRSDIQLNPEQVVGLVTLALGFYFVTKSAGGVQQ